MTSLRAQILGVLESYGDADDRLITELDGIAAENVSGGGVIRPA